MPNLLWERKVERKIYIGLLTLLQNKGGFLGVNSNIRKFICILRQLNVCEAIVVLKSDSL